jgi:hypothetical protein
LGDRRPVVGGCKKKCERSLLLVSFGTKEHSFRRMHALSLLIFPELKPKLRRLLMISTGGKFNCGGKIIGGEEKK